MWIVNGEELARFGVNELASCVNDASATGGCLVPTSLLMKSRVSKAAIVGKLVIEYSIRSQFELSEDEDLDWDEIVHFLTRIEVVLPHLREDSYYSSQHTSDHQAAPASSNSSCAKFQLNVRMSTGRSLEKSVPEFYGRL